MRVNHRCPHISVAQKLLNGSDVITLLQQVGGKAVPKGVTAPILKNMTLHYGILHSFLHGTLRGDLATGRELPRPLVSVG